MVVVFKYSRNYSSSRIHDIVHLSSFYYYYYIRAFFKIIRYKERWQRTKAQGIAYSKIRMQKCKNIFLLSFRDRKCAEKLYYYTFIVSLQEKRKCHQNFCKNIILKFIYHFHALFKNHFGLSYQQTINLATCFSISGSGEKKRKEEA